MMRALRLPALLTLLVAAPPALAWQPPWLGCREGYCMRADGLVVRERDLRRQWEREERWRERAWRREREEWRRAQQGWHGWPPRRWRDDDDDDD